MENPYQYELQVAKELTLKMMETYKLVGSQDAIVDDVPSKYGKIFQTFFKAVREAERLDINS